MRACLKKKKKKKRVTIITTTKKGSTWVSHPWGRCQPTTANNRKTKQLAKKTPTPPTTTISITPRGKTTTKQTMINSTKKEKRNTKVTPSNHGQGRVVEVKAHTVQ